MEIYVLANFTDILADGTILSSEYSAIQENDNCILKVYISRRDFGEQFLIDKVDVFSDKENDIKKAIEKLHQYFVINKVDVAVRFANCADELLKVQALRYAISDIGWRSGFVLTFVIYATLVTVLNHYKEDYWITYKYHFSSYVIEMNEPGNREPFYKSGEDH